MEYEFYLKGLKYVDSSKVSSLTFSATTKHEIEDYDGSLYEFDIDNIGTSTITGIIEKPLRTQNN